MNIGAKIKSLDVVMKGIGFNKPEGETNIRKKATPTDKLAKTVVLTSVSILCNFICLLSAVKTGLGKINQVVIIFLIMNYLVIVDKLAITILFIIIQ